MIKKNTHKFLVSLPHAKMLVENQHKTIRIENSKMIDKGEYIQFLGSLPHAKMLVDQVVSCIGLVIPIGALWIYTEDPSGDPYGGGSWCNCCCWLVGGGDDGGRPYP